MSPFNPKNLYLERVGGGSHFRNVRFDKESSVLGRHESCDLIVGGRTVSRKHSQFTFANGKLYVTNLSASTSTFLNDDKVLEKTEVELGDLIGLGTRVVPENGELDKDEFFVYKCCVIPTVDLVSDDETEATSQNSEISSNINAPLPARLDSPGFSSTSETSTSTIRNRRNQILNITNELSDSRIRECFVRLKHLSSEELKRHEESQPSTPHDTNATSSKQNSPKKAETSSNIQKRIEIVISKTLKKKEKPPKKQQKSSLTFSRTKYDTQKKVQKIKRRMSKLVDPDSDDERNEKKLKKERRSSKHSNDRHSTDSKRSRNSLDSKKSRHSMDSRRNEESKDSRTEEKKNGHDTASKSKDKKTKPVQSSNTSKQPTQETKTDQNKNEVFLAKKRSRSNSPSVSDPDAPLKKSARVSPPQRPSTSNIETLTFDFPCMEDTTEKLKSSLKSAPRRHRSMFVESPDRSSKRQSSTDNLIQSRQMAMVNKKSNEIRKQIKNRTKSVGERPNQNADDRKQKLKELAQKNQVQQKPEEPRKMSISDSRGIAMGTAKVKITTENRGNFLMQEIPKINNAKTVNKKPEPLKSAADRFRERHVKETGCSQSQATSSQINGNSILFYGANDADDLQINIEVQPPTLNVFNQPMSSIPQVTPHELPSEVVKTPTASIAPFPLVILDPTVLERTKGTDELISILKPPLDPKKKHYRVSFRDPIYDIREIRPYIVENDHYEGQHNFTSSQPRTPLKDLEISIAEEIMGWHTDWLELPHIPEQWKIRAMKTTYESLEEYKEILSALIRVELFSKMKNSSIEIAKGMDFYLKNGHSKEWTQFLLRSKNLHGNGQRLVLDWYNQNTKNSIFKNGLLLIVRVNQTTKNSIALQQPPKDILFFGYVTATSESTLTIDAMVRDLPPNLSALKCKPLLYINNEIRSMVAIMNLLDTDLIRKFLNPGLNKLLTSVDDNSFLKIDSVLDEKQKQMVNVITAECLKEQNDSNIITLCSMAGTGKTRMLIESLVNTIRCSKKDGRPCSILVCTMSNVLTDQIATQTAAHRSLHKNDKLARIGEFKEIGLAAQKLHRRIDDNLKSYDVIFTTVTHAHEIYNYIDHFDICFIDDANMVIDSELVILLQFNIKKLFLIGDIMQTQPMIESSELKNSKYDETCFARMVNFFKNIHDENKPILQLKSQHRMCNELTKIVETFIYKNNNFHNNENQIGFGSVETLPFLVIGIQGGEHLNTFQQLKVINSKWREIFSTLPGSIKICVIVANEVNMRLIQHDAKQTAKEMGKDVIVCRINEITFSEVDAIILAAASKEEIDWMCRNNKLNKVLTRARHAIRIVGSPSFFDGNITFSNLWNALANFAKAKKFYRQFYIEDRNNDL